MRMRECICSTEIRIVETSNALLFLQYTKNTRRLQNLQQTICLNKRDDARGIPTPWKHHTQTQTSLSSLGQ